MDILKQIGQYLYLVKKDPNEKPNREVRAMHWMNKTSLIVFLIAIVIMIIKLLMKK